MNEELELKGSRVRGKETRGDERGERMKHEKLFAEEGKHVENETVNSKATLQLGTELVSAIGRSSPGCENKLKF